AHGPPAPTAERPANREPGARSRALSMLATRNPGTPRSFTEAGSAHRAIRGIGSEAWASLPQVLDLPGGGTLAGRVLRAPLRAHGLPLCCNSVITPRRRRSLLPRPGPAVHMFP